MTTTLADSQEQAAATPAISAAKAWLNIGLLFLCLALNSMDKQVMGLAAVPIMKELHLTPSQYGVLASSFYSLYAVSGMLFAAFVVRRMSSKWLLVLLALIWSISQLPIAFTSSISILFACRILLGVGEGPGTPSVLNAAYSWFPSSKRSLPSAICVVGVALGAALGAPFLSNIIAAHGWRAGFLTCGLLGFAWVVVWAMLGSNGPLGGERLAKDSAVSAPSTVAARLVWLDPTIIGSLVVGFCAYWVQGIILAWVNAYFQQGLGLAPRLAGSLTGLVNAAPILFLLGAPAVSQLLINSGRTMRVSWGLMNALCMLISAAGLMCAVVIAAPMVKVFGLALAMGGAVTTFVLGPLIAAEVAPIERRGQILLGIYSSVTISGFLSPILAGVLVQRAPSMAVGYGQALLLTAAVAAVGAVAAALLLNPEKSRRRIAAQQVFAPTA